MSEALILFESLRCERLLLRMRNLYIVLLVEHQFLVLQQVQDPHQFQHR